jgi:hypothetical protein
MITWKDVVGIVVIMLLLTIYALFKDDPMKGLENAGQYADKIFNGLKKLVKEIEKI